MRDLAKAVFEIQAVKIQVPCASETRGSLVGHQALARRIQPAAAQLAGGAQGDAYLKSSGRLALQFLKGFFQQFDVELEADVVDLAGLFAAQQISRSPEFQVERGHAEAAA